MLRCLKFNMYHCLVDLYQVCSNGGPGVQNGPAQDNPRFESWKYFENIHFFLQHHLPEMLEIRYVALPSGSLPSLFKPRSQGPKCKKYLLLQNHLAQLLEI